MRGLPRNSPCARRIVLGMALVASVAAACTASAPAASTGSTTVGANVLSATNLTVTSCAQGAAATTIPPLATSSTGATTAPCRLTWGSSNDLAMLKVFQSDGAGQALWRPAHGQLDPTFGGGDGVTDQDFAQDFITHGGFAQTDDKTVTFGQTSETSLEMSIARFNDDGTFDNGFGGGDGWESIGWPGSVPDASFGGLRRADGRYVLVGFTGGADEDFALAGFTAAGVADPAFGGGDGRAQLHVSATDVLSSAVELSDGSILATGWTVQGSDSGIALARFLADGTPDTSWGGDGVIEVDPTGGDERPTEIAVHPSTGDILVAGNVDDTADDSFGMNDVDLFAARFTAAGALVGGWGTGGFTRFDANGGMATPEYETHSGMTIDSQGRVVLAGGAYPGAVDHIAVARTTAAGLPDASFAPGGLAVLDVRPTHDGAWAEDVVALPDDRLQLAGFVLTGGTPELASFRVTTAGALDTTFGSDGIDRVTDATAPTLWSWYRGSDVAVGRDGRVSVFGSLSGWDVGIARWHGTPVADHAVGSTDFNGSGANAFGACLETATNGTGGAGVNAWTVAGAGNCTANAAGNGFWNDVVTGPAVSGAKVAQSSSANQQSVVTDLFFAFRTASNQPTGSYVAPVTFEVVAPAA